jgi:hypothetical protein
MLRSMTDLLTYLAQHAGSLNQNVLAHICRIGALEAHKNNASSPIPVVGIWDWDVANDIDSTCAELLGIDPRKGSKGVPNHSCIAALHPDDIAQTSQRLERAVRVGGELELEYRIIKNGATRWYWAKGFCTLDKSLRPERLAGAILEMPSPVI